LASAGALVFVAMAAPGEDPEDYLGDGSDQPGAPDPDPELTDPEAGE
jgi:hypothetical protein